ncbi:hypothetical protein [Pseudomonas guariconensis]|uniref:hypothetical protein n=1 Tax=Pseudomonas guariconensis TaxID=1288410 RepID=UPI00209AD687|nr:hypothetical protein [Pseudomonas guariconensis]MCO7620110.1 hypothetical protein [Pseudomonas guariconensis]
MVKSIRECCQWQHSSYHRRRSLSWVVVRAAPPLRGTNGAIRLATAPTPGSEKWCGPHHLHGAGGTTRLAIGADVGF